MHAPAWRVHVANPPASFLLGILLTLPEGVRLLQGALGREGRQYYAGHLGPGRHGKVLEDQEDLRLSPRVAGLPGLLDQRNQLVQFGLLVPGQQVTHVFQFPGGQDTRTPHRAIEGGQHGLKHFLGTGTVAHHESFCELTVNT
ncbi:hypothetical protein [Ktedonospora formicarum]|uniref:hypothetical protein n=1 Tax=Ktedonospora formicarum TaxID=2778364 RepID=UPI001C68F1E5|nr:hypothetical protein [Ktedonospora formicarum]